MRFLRYAIADGLTRWNAEYRPVSADRSQTCKTRWQFYHLRYIQQTFYFIPNWAMLFTVIHCEQCNHINSVCSSQLILCSLPPFSSDVGMRTRAPLLHCSINNTVIDRVPHCQNTFTKLVNVLDPIFVEICNPALYNLYRIPGTKIIITLVACRYSGYILPLKWTKSILLVKFLGNSTCRKLSKSVHFWWNI